MLEKNGKMAVRDITGLFFSCGHLSSIGVGPKGGYGSEEGQGVVRYSREVRIGCGSLTNSLQLIAITDYGHG